MAQVIRDSLEEGEEGLLIPLSSIYEEMCCPICFNLISDCHITPCGHNFCKSCVLECLNREHVCPCCRSPCQKQEARKNRHVDKLIQILRAEKEKASKLYFENLVKVGGGGSGLSGSREPVLEPEAERSPIEQVFQKYMKKTMGSYQSYFKQLEEKFEKQKSDLRDHLVVQLTDRKMLSEQVLRKLKADASLSPAKRDGLIQKEKDEACAVVASLTERCNHEVATLQEEFDSSVGLLIEAYERYLETIKPSPKFLPLTVNVSLPAYKITLKSISLKATDTVEDLKEKILERMKQLGNPIHKFGSNPVFTLYPLFGSGDEKKGREEEMEQEGILLKENVAIVLCSDPSPPQGSLITLAVNEGMILESDKPKECFTQQKFVKGESKCTYYTCSTCNINWVCSTCAEVCHSEHSTKPYLSDHKPNWACCYCVKYKKCKIVKKKK